MTQRDAKNLSFWLTFYAIVIVVSLLLRAWGNMP